MSLGKARSGLTRRQALAGAAAMGAGLALPGAASGRSPAAPAGAELFSISAGPLAGTTPVLLAPRPFSLIGAAWRGARHARLELRVELGDGRWSRWGQAGVAGHGPDHPAATGDVVSGDPLWVGRARRLQLRSDRPLEDVTLNFVAPDPRAARASAAWLPPAEPSLQTAAGQPPIIARSAWDRGQVPPAAPAFGEVKLGFVHHTENLNGYSAGEVPAMLYAIYVFHRFVRGWDDIGYNFVVDLYGRIWEARTGGIDQAIIGAQAGGFNAVSTGIALLGTFTAAAPSPQSRAALERLLAWKLSLHGTPVHGRVTVLAEDRAALYSQYRTGQRVSLPRIAGHRDGDSTDCPGDVLYGELPGIRAAAARLVAGRASRLSLSAPEHLLAGATATLTGRLETLSGQPIAGAAIELQRLAGAHREPYAQLVTAGDGSFGYAVALERTLLVAALYAQPPAAVSPASLIAVAPVLTLTLTATSPATVAGTVSPGRGHVLLAITRRHAGRRKRLPDQRVPVSGGAFSAPVRTRGPGTYEVRAITHEDALNAAGRSPAVSFTLPAA